MSTDYEGRSLGNSMGEDLNDMLPLLQYLPNKLIVSQIGYYLQGKLTSDTIQNWVKRGIIEAPTNRSYTKDQVAKIIMIDSLRSALELKDIRDLFDYLFDPSAYNSEKIKTFYTIFSNLANRNMVGVPATRDLIDKILADYPHFSGSEVKIRDALMIMNYAYLCGKLKHQALEMFKKKIPSKRDYRRRI